MTRDFSLKLGPAQSHTQWLAVEGAFASGRAVGEVTLTIHLGLMSKFRISRAIVPLLRISSWLATLVLLIYTPLFIILFAF
jgi:hypothetical protein